MARSFCAVNKVPKPQLLVQDHMYRPANPLLTTHLPNLFENNRRTRLVIPLTDVADKPNPKKTPWPLSILLTFRGRLNLNEQIFVARQLKSRKSYICRSGTNVSSSCSLRASFTHPVHPSHTTRFRRALELGGCYRLPAVLFFNGPQAARRVLASRYSKTFQVAQKER